MVHANFEPRFNRDSFFQSRDNTYMNRYFMFIAVTYEEASFLIQVIHIIFLLFLRVSQYK